MYQHTLLCNERLVPRNISSRFSRNSKGNPSEFLENCEEMFPRYWSMSHEKNDYIIKC